MTFLSVVNFAMSGKANDIYVSCSVQGSSPRRVRKCSHRIKNGPSLVRDYRNHLNQCPSAKGLHRKLIAPQQEDHVKVLNGYPMAGPPGAPGLYAETMLSELASYSRITLLSGEILNTFCQSYDSDDKCAGWVRFPRLFFLSVFCDLFNNFTVKILIVNLAKVK